MSFTRVFNQPFPDCAFGVVKKLSSPGSFCIIKDFLFSPDCSAPLLNVQIDPALFLCIWGVFVVVTCTIAHVSPCTCGITLDVCSAYCQITVRLEDQTHTVLMWGNRFYINSHIPFGAVSSNRLFAQCSDSMADFYKLHSFSIIHKWVNNFLFIQDPDSFSQDAHVQVILFKLFPICDYADKL